MERKELPIESIVADENIQIRVGINSSRVDEFTEIYADLPEWWVIKTPEGKHILADGFHRRQAALRKGYKKAWCKIEEGDYKRALEIAIQENCRGPLNLTRQEKQNTVEKALKYFPERANSWIAEMVGVSMQTVEKVRKMLESSKTIKTYDKLTTRDGRSYPREIVEKVGVNLDKEDEDRSNSPSKEDLIASLSEPRRVRPEVSGFKTPDIFSGDYARQGKAPERKDDKIEKTDSLFVEDMDIEGEVIGATASSDKRKAVRLIEKDDKMIIAIYYVKEDRFYNDSYVILDKENFFDLISAMQSAPSPT